MLAANLCSFEGEVPGDLPPLDSFDDRSKLNVIVTVGDEDDNKPVCISRFYTNEVDYDICSIRFLLKDIC